MRFGVGFTKTVYGMMIVEAKDKEEAKEKFLDGDIEQEFDNKSDYVYNEEDGEPVFEEMAN